LVINLHAHLGHKNMQSDTLWNLSANYYSNLMGIPLETIRKQMAQFQNYDAKLFVEQMDAAGIDKALVMAVDFGMNPDVGEGPWSIEEINQWVVKQAEEYPDKLLTLCAIDPRRGERAIKLLEKAVQEWDMKGLKLHPTTGYYPDDPAFFPLYKKCLELDVPVYSHTAATIGPPFMSKYADPIYLDTIAAKLPDLKIVLIHFGSLSYHLKCAEIMFTRSNVYAELSGYQAQALLMPEYFLKNLRSIFDAPGIKPHKDRLMFGTDWPMLEAIMDQKTWVDWIKNIPEKGKEYGLKFKQREIKKILNDNAKKFLNL